MLVFSELVRRHGTVVSSAELLNAAWSDRVVSRDSVTTAIYQLRQLLGDKAYDPLYIRSEPRRGYRLIATCKHASVGKRHTWRWALPILVVTIASITWFFNAGSPVSAARYLVVEPLLDQSRMAELAPLSAAIESTLLGELISIAPGRIMSAADDTGRALTMQTAVVACDRGPALVVRVHDPLQQTYVWSGAYPLDEVSAAKGGATLVEHIASEVAGAFLAGPK